MAASKPDKTARCGECHREVSESPDDRFDYFCGHCNVEWLEDDVVWM